jgi:hypothetical protein
MGTLKGFPCPPALWLRRAKPAFAHALMVPFARRFPARLGLGLLQKIGARAQPAAGQVAAKHGQGLE